MSSRGEATVNRLLVQQAEDRIAELESELEGLLAAAKHSVEYLDPSSTWLRDAIHHAEAVLTGL
jgi:hypothetical protein